jgi:TRAP transporter TAXI family solute receptor
LGQLSSTLRALLTRRSSDGFAAGVAALSRRRVLLGLGAGCTVALGAGGLRLFPTGAAGAATAAAQDLAYFRIGAGVVGSRLYQLAGTVAAAITNPPGAENCDERGPCGVPGLIALAQTTAGSFENLQDLGAGSVESAMTQIDVAAAALAGSGAFKAAGPNAGLRALARIGSAVIQVVVPAKSAVQSIADLKGRVIAVGPKQGDAALTAPAVLAAYGITGKRTKLDNSDLATAAAGFAAGSIDALIVVDAAPNPDLASLGEQADIRLLDIVGAPREKLLADNPYLRATRIPEGTYRDQPATQTLQIPILWTVQASMEDSLAYGLARALGSQLGPNPEARAGGALDFSTAVATGPLVLHPGAQRYFAERKAAAGSTN